MEMLAKTATLICLVLVASLGCACGSQSANNVRVGVYNGSVVIPAFLNGKPVSFLLDTGSSRSTVDMSVVDRLQLETGAATDAVGNYGVQSLRTVRVQNIKVGGAEFKDQTLVITNLDPVSRAVGVAVDGVLGNDALKTLTFKLNYSKQSATFGILSQFDNLGTPIKLREERNEFFVPTRLLSVSRDLLLDTGTNSTNLSWEAWEQLSKLWTPKSVIDGIVSSANSSATAFLVCLPAIEVGNVEIKDQAVRVQKPVKTGAFSEAGFSGILGSDFLRQFEVTFDLGHSLLFLKPDPDFRPDPYKYVTIGIQFAKDASGVFTVMSVWKNSPAAAAGILPGDRIIGIDGRSAEVFTLGQFSKKLHAKAGTLVKLKIERQKSSLEVAVKTRKLLC
jgi:predicted aspartyl protease